MAPAAVSQINSRDGPGARRNLREHEPGRLRRCERAPRDRVRTICYVLPSAATPECLHRAAQAFDGHDLAWWSTGADPHRGAADAQVKDRGLGGDPRRIRGLPAGYLVSQPIRAVLPPQLTGSTSAGDHPLILLLGDVEVTIGRYGGCYGRRGYSRR